MERLKSFDGQRMTLKQMSSIRGGSSYSKVYNFNIEGKCYQSHVLFSDANETQQWVVVEGNFFQVPCDNVALPPAPTNNMR